LTTGIKPQTFSNKVKPQLFARPICCFCKKI